MSAISRASKFLATARLKGALLALAVLLIFAAPPANDFHSISNGAFDANGVWSTTGADGGSCGCSPSCTVPSSGTLTISDTVTSNCSLLLLKGSAEVSIQSPGHFIITGDVELRGNSEFTIDSNATVTINGDLDVGGSSVFTVNGTLNLNGDAATAGSGTVCGQGTANITGTASGSGWCFSNDVLPIKLISFDAELTETQNVKLSWATSAEVNNDVFILERSENGMSFFEIAQEPGNGNSQDRIDYSYVDAFPGNGLFYYRLSQIDFDGRSETFELVAIEIGENETGECVLTVIPNPCVPNCRAVLSDCSDPTIETYILDANGTLIRKLIPVRTEDKGYSYDISKNNFLMPGVYVVNSRSARLNTSKKIIVR